MTTPCTFDFDMYIYTSDTSMYCTYVRTYVHVKQEAAIERGGWGGRRGSGACGWHGTACICIIMYIIVTRSSSTTSRKNVIIQKYKVYGQTQSNEGRERESIPRQDAPKKKNLFFCVELLRGPLPPPNTPSPFQRTYLGGSHFSTGSKIHIHTLRAFCIFVCLYLARKRRLFFLFFVFGWFIRYK